MENISHVPDGAPKVRKVMAVTGPSGAGKTTFISQLAAGALPAEIRSRLPVGIEDWPVFEANDCLKDGTKPADIQGAPDALEGLLIHYDIAFIYRHGLQRYEDDPAAEFFMKPEHLTLVCITPDPEELRVQFALRHDRHMRTKSPMSRFWRRFIRHPVRHAWARVKGRRFYGTDDLYRSVARIEECYAAWARFIALLAKDKPDTEIMYVEPYLDETGNPAFRVIPRP